MLLRRKREAIYSMIERRFFHECPLHIKIVTNAALAVKGKSDLFYGKNESRNSSGIQREIPFAALL
jgi:hypothetical protein